MSYEEFKIAYTDAFGRMYKYKINECGSEHYANKMAELSDLYPEYELRLEDELEAA